MSARSRSRSIDVEPATFERCALIRDWLDDHGIDRATLLVIPAPDLHPFFHRRPDLAAWLLDCRDRGDAIAQHGFQHRPGGRRAAAEFAGLSPEATRASLEAGRRVLALAGVAPRGFVGRSASPALAVRAPLTMRAGSRAAGRVLRLDLHPADFDRPRRVHALESVLRGAHGRRAMSYDELC